MSEAINQRSFLLATLPPTQGQTRLAFGVIAVLFIAFSLTMPFTNTRLARVDAFIPAFQTAILFTDLITSTLLFSQYYVVRKRSLLILASGFLFTALIVIPHTLSFPGVFAPKGLLGDGPQTTAMLYYFWHMGSPLAVILYVRLKDTDIGTHKSKRSLPTVIGSSVAVVIAIVGGLTLIASRGDQALPTIFYDTVHMNHVPHLVGGLMLAFWTASAFVLLYLRRRTVLDLWLLVMCFAWLVEVTINAFLVERFNLGWYASRIADLSGSVFVLLVLLSETTALYANLAESVMRQRNARQAREIAMETLAASIAHEVRQPLGAMTTNADAATIYLSSEAPDVKKAIRLLARIVEDGHRASDVIGGVQSMFSNGRHGRVLVDANDVVRDALEAFNVDFRIQRVSVVTELGEKLPRLVADRGQLLQVFLNLMTNAIESMSSITDRPRLLRVRTDVAPQLSSVIIVVEDSGVGINRADIDRIFDPFFTTKSTGTGVGLNICHSIIEAHDGKMEAFVNRPHGMRFFVSLPVADL
jgi:signal transduction histidine kinase